MSIDPISKSSLSQSTGPSDPLGRIGSSRATQKASDVGVDFSEVLGDAIAGMAQQLRKAEAVSVAGVRGAASTQEVVEQIMSAEQALQASIAVRDKIVAAYLEISRMQI